MKIDTFETLEKFRQVREQLDPGLFITALIAALLAAYAAAGMYRFFYERRGTGSQVHRAFPLLAIAITTLFIGVQLSIPLSLGLLGSLSIIRFRTPIKEPEEVGFIMLVIAASISAATFNFRFLLLMYVVAFISLLLTRGARAWKLFTRDGVLVLTVPAEQAPAHMSAVETVLKSRLKRFQLESSSIRDGQANFQYVFSGLKSDVPQLQAELARQVPVQSINIFLDQDTARRNADAAQKTAHGLDPTRFAGAKRARPTNGERFFSSNFGADHEQHVLQVEILRNLESTDHDFR